MPRTLAQTTLLAFYCCLSIGCSRPAIKQTSVDGEVRSVGNWQVKWDGESQKEQTKSQTGLDFSEYRSKYTVADYCLDYIDAIRHALASKHGLPLMDNIPVTGIIEVGLYGRKIRLPAVSATDAEKFARELRRERAYDYSAVEEDQAYEGLSFSWGKGDVVSRVDIRFLNADGKLLGELFIGGKPGDDVSAKYVASAIARILK